MNVKCEILIPPLIPVNDFKILYTLFKEVFVLELCATQYASTTHPLLIFYYFYQLNLFLLLYATANTVSDARTSAATESKIIHQQIPSRC